MIQQKKKKTKVFRSEMDGSSRTDRQQKMWQNYQTGQSHWSLICFLYLLFFLVEFRIAFHLLSNEQFLSRFEITRTEGVLFFKKFFLHVCINYTNWIIRFNCIYLDTIEYMNRFENEYHHILIMNTLRLIQSIEYH